MNITLSHKDADFILKYLRADLERVNKCGSDLTEKRNNYKEKIDKCSSVVSGPELILANGLIEVADEMLEESEEIKKDLLRCIELLTVGSEVENGAA